MRSAVGLGVFATWLACSGVARAETSAPPAAPALKLRLWTVEPGLRLELYRSDQRPGRADPLTACVQTCTLAEPAGRYRLFVKGPEGSGVHANFRDFTLERPLFVTVRPGYSTPRWVGLTMAIVGMPTLAFGMLYAVVHRSNGLAGGGDMTTGEKLVAASTIGAGVGLTLSGWILFGTNRRPTLKFAALGP